MSTRSGLSVPYYQNWQVGIMYGIPFALAMFLAVNGNPAGGWGLGSGLAVAMFSVGTVLIYGKREILD